MASDVHNVVSKYTTCDRAKNTFDQRLYARLPILNNPWEDVSMKSVLGLRRNQRRHDSIMGVIDQFFSKMAYLFPSTKLMMPLTLLNFTLSKSSSFIDVKKYCLWLGCQTPILHLVILKPAAKWSSPTKPYPSFLRNWWAKTSKNGIKSSICWVCLQLGSYLCYISFPFTLC